MRRCPSITRKRIPRSDALQLEQIGYRTRFLNGTCGYDDSLPHRGAIAVVRAKSDGPKWNVVEVRSRAVGIYISPGEII
jgi:hypothetical protein